MLERKGFTGLCLHITVDHYRNQDRNSNRTESWRQELMQRL